MLQRTIFMVMVVTLLAAVGCSSEPLADSFGLASVSNPSQAVLDTGPEHDEVLTTRSSAGDKQAYTGSIASKRVIGEAGGDRDHTPQVSSTPLPTVPLPTVPLPTVPLPTVPPTPRPDPSALVKISVGDNHACGIREDRQLVCWGTNDKGQADPPEGRFVEIASGRNHSCAINTDQIVECWGHNSNSAATPPTNSFLKIDGFHDAYCGIQTNFAINCWGGRQDYYSETSWPAGRFMDVATGGLHKGCAIHDSGRVTCWYDGQSYTLESVYKSVSVGENNWTCGVEGSGTLRCWAIDDNQQLVKLYGDYQAVSTGEDASVCGLRDDGELRCIAEQYSLLPEELEEMKFIAVDSSPTGDLICAVTERGAPVCWTWESDLNTYYIWGTIWSSTAP